MSDSSFSPSSFSSMRAGWILTAFALALVALSATESVGLLGQATGSCEAFATALCSAQGKACQPAPAPDFFHCVTAPATVPPATIAPSTFTPSAVTNTVEDFVDNVGCRLYLTGPLYSTRVGSPDVFNPQQLILSFDIVNGHLSRTLEKEYAYIRVSNVNIPNVPQSIPLPSAIAPRSSIKLTDISLPFPGPESGPYFLSEVAKIIRVSDSAVLAQCGISHKYNPYRFYVPGNTPPPGPVVPEVGLCRLGNLPDTVRAGQQFSVDFGLSNLGGGAWTKEYYRLKSGDTSLPDINLSSTVYSSDSSYYGTLMPLMVTAPSTPGSFIPSFTLRTDDGTHAVLDASDPSFHTLMTCTAPRPITVLEANFKSATCFISTPAITAGKDFTANVRVTNTGNLPLNAADNYKLFASTGTRTELGKGVDVGTFVDVPVTMNIATAGSTTLEFGVAIEGQTAITEQNCTKTVTVQPAPALPPVTCEVLEDAAHPVPSNVPGTGTFPIYVRVTNNRTTTLSAPYQIQSATTRTNLPSIAPGTYADVRVDFPPPALGVFLPTFGVADDTTGDVLTTQYCRVSHSIFAGLTLQASSVPAVSSAGNTLNAVSSAAASSVGNTLNAVSSTPTSSAAPSPSACNIFIDFPSSVNVGAPLSGWVSFNNNSGVAWTADRYHIVSKASGQHFNFFAPYGVGDAYGVPVQLTAPSTPQVLTLRLGVDVQNANGGYTDIIDAAHLCTATITVVDPSITIGPNLPSSSSAGTASASSQGDFNTLGFTGASSSRASSLAASSVAPVDTGTCTVFSAPASPVSPNAPLTIQLSVTNRGNIQWSNGYSVVTSPANSFTPLNVNVSPSGGIGFVNIPVTAPAAGTLNPTFVVRNPAGLNVTPACALSSPIQVSQPASSAAASSTAPTPVTAATCTIISAPDTVLPNASFPVTVTVTNTGNTTWLPNYYKVKSDAFSTFISNGLPPGASQSVATQYRAPAFGTFFVQISVGAEYGAPISFQNCTRQVTVVQPASSAAASSIAAAPVYSATCAVSNAPATVAPNTSFPVSVTVTNTGNAAWTNRGYKVMSIYEHTPIGNGPSPGFSQSVTTNYTSPASGTFTMVFGVAQENSPAITAQTCTRQVTVQAPAASSAAATNTGFVGTPGNHGQCVDMIGTPSVVHRGQSFTAIVRMKNTGTTDWTTTGNYKLMAPGIRAAIPGGILKPGETAQFNVPLTAPSTPGYNTLVFGIGIENVGAVTQPDEQCNKLQVVN